MDAIFYAMAEYLRDISAEELKTLFDSGVIKQVDDIHDGKVIIDVDRCICYMSADIGGEWYSVWCDGGELSVVYDEDDHSSYLIKICKFEEFMLSFIPWYHVELCPTKSLDAPIIKEAPKSLATIPFLGVE